MRLSEIVIIYLAAAAPVGVVYFLSRAHAPRATALGRAAAAALAWPLTLAAFWFERRRATPRHASGEARGREAHGPDEARGEEAKRALLGALRRAEGLFEESFGAGDERTRRVLLAARGGVERYAGLALAVASTDADAAPSARELELCRIAGRKGDDLLLAGRCVHRNNFARLVAHRERARQELLHALADVRGAHPETRGAGGTSSPATLSEGARPAGFLSLSEVLLQVCARAVELFSAFDDRRAALAVARLLDAECARLRRLQTSTHSSAHERATEGELCLPRPAPSAPNPERTASPLPRLLEPMTPTRG